MSNIMIPVLGNTYPVRDQIRALGGRWNPTTKLWSVPADVHAQAQALIGPAREHRLAPAAPAPVAQPVVVQPAANHPSPSAQRFWQFSELAAQLSQSAYLDPTDDLQTEAGIVATSIAILERISNGERLREVSWQPVRLAGKVEPKLDDSAPRQAPTAPTGGPSTKIEVPVPPPITPRPGSAAVTLKRREPVADFSF